MADKKKGKQRKFEEEKPTKEEYAVAKYLRFNLPVRDGKMHGMEVKCFFGNAAVDKLLESSWSASKNKKDPLFSSRAQCVSYMLTLLEKGLFHRAEREKRKKDKDKDKPRKKKRDKDAEKEESAADEELRERKPKKEKRSKKEKEGEGDEEPEKKTDKKEEKKKKEKRLKLVMPEKQFFEDGDEVYVWIYDPVNAKNFLIGLLMVLGAIALCMFPLWPEEVRIGVYYLSLAAAGFVGFILSLVVVRLILFCCIWLVTLGKHHFWFLPNLTEDVGFFESFRPLYKHDLSDSFSDSKSGGDGGKKEKSSDKDDSDEFELIKKEDLDENGAKNEDNVKEEEEGDNEAGDDYNDDEDDNNENGDDNGDDDDYDDEEDNNGENGESEEDMEEEEEEEEEEEVSTETKKDRKKKN